MTEALSFPKHESISGTRLKRLVDGLRVYSSVLKCWIEIEMGFVHDEESTPWRGDNPLGGLIHDYLCRYDSIPTVTQWQAAMIYLEFMCYEDSLHKKSWHRRLLDCAFRNVKAGFVGITPLPRFFHKLSVKATVEEMLEQG